MGWDLKGKLGKLFGGAGKAEPASAGQASALSPALVEYQAQVGDGTHREYSPAELNEIIECMRQLKDITQASLLAIQRLAEATPKPGYPEAKAMCDGLQALKRQPFQDQQNVLVELNARANQLEGIRTRIARTYQAGRNDSHLPVCDAERLLVIGIAGQVQGAYRTHAGLVSQVSNVERFVDIPEYHRVIKGLADSAEKIEPLLLTVCRITSETVGRTPAAGADRQPVLAP